MIDFLFSATTGAIYLDSDVNTVRKVFCQLAFDESVSVLVWFINTIVKFLYFTPCSLSI